MQKKNPQKKIQENGGIFVLDFSFAIFCLFLTTFGYYFSFLYYFWFLVFWEFWNFFLWIFPRKHPIHFSIRLKRRKCPWFWASFLGSSNYTDAKKILEKLIYWCHLACFFQNKICQKNFFGQNSSGRSKKHF